MRWQRLLPLPLLLLCTACGLFEQADHFGAFPVTYDNLSDWPQDNHAEALATFTASCPIFAKKARGTSSGSDLKLSTALWKSLCDDALAVPPGDAAQARAFFERRFIPYRITNNDKEPGLFTGYYQPVLYGSYKKRGNYKYPLYLPPTDLKERSPYYTHHQINHGVLRNRGLELVWVDDPVMRFFLQIQGSGRVILPDGSSILVGYAGQNGYQYVALGKVMADEGLMEKDKINFFTLRQWLYDHPDQAFEMMERNPSYVFFKKLEVDGVVGAAGAILTPQRSLAVDSKYIPYGLPLFLEAMLPSRSGASLPFRRIMIAQDTGGAIRGPVRGDVFFGEGADAEYFAGYMKGRGIYSLLVPKEITSQLE